MTYFKKITNTRALPLRYHDDDGRP